MRSRVILATLAAPLLLALPACGGPAAKGRADFIAECKDSDDAKTCICIADQLKAEAEPEVYEALMAAAAKDEQRGEQMVEDLTLAQKLSIPRVMIRAAVSCGKDKADRDIND